MEISPQLAALQLAKVAGGQPQPAPWAAIGRGGSSFASSGGSSAASRRVMLTGGHVGRFDVRQHDATDVAAWAAHDAAERRGRGQNHPTSSAAAAAASPAAAAAAEPSDEHCFIIACEVLDNLPHDRVWRPSAGDPWQQTLVTLPPAAADGGDSDRACAGSRSGGSGVASSSRGSGWTPEEVLAPADDALVRRCMACLDEADAEQAGSSGRGGGGMADRLAAAARRLLAGAAGEAVWLPTGCLRLLDTLHTVT